MSGQQTLQTDFLFQTDRPGHIFDIETIYAEIKCQKAYNIRIGNASVRIAI